MIYRFTDSQSTFEVKAPHRYQLYFPLTNRQGSILSAISPRLAGDIKADNDHFLTPPASIEDLRSNMLCRRDFFIKTGQRVIRASTPYRDTLEAGLLYHKLIKRTGPFRIEILNFVPFDLAVEVMWVKVFNISQKAVPITPTSFIPLFGRGERNLRDHRHVSALLNRLTLEKFGIHLKPTMIFDEKGHTVNKATYFVYGFQGDGSAPEGQFPTLDCFFGQGDILSPEAITKEKAAFTSKTPDFDGKEACAAFRFKKTVLKKGQEADYFLIMGIAQEPTKLKKQFLALNSRDKIIQSLSGTKKFWLEYLSKVEFDFQDKDYTNWLRWVCLQPTLRKLFGCSFLPHFDYGKGGRGWRDLWQDALALLLFEPKKARGLILDNFKGVRIDGSNATIVTRQGEFISDRNRISRVWMDHGVWPYLTLKLYLNKTDDLDFLLEQLPYFRDRHLSRAKEVDDSPLREDFLLRTRSGAVYKGSVLEHLLVENLVPFFHVGAHNIMRLENGDWNDGLDMAAGKGQSVAFSFMYAHNLADMCSFLRGLAAKKRNKLSLAKEITLLLDTLHRPVDYKDFKEKQKRLTEYFTDTRQPSGKRVEIETTDLIKDLEAKAAHVFEWLRSHEWLDEGFFNGYYDNQGKAVEGKIGARMRMMLPSQVFAIISEGATQAQVRKTWASAKKYLWDKELKGFRLNTDFGALYLDFGRAFGFAYGDKENGAFFNHMAILFAYGLYRRGFIQEGRQVLRSVYAMATSQRSCLYPMIPEYVNNEGRGLYLYLTGSGSWYLYTLMEQVLGITFKQADIVLEPKLTPEDFFSENIRVKFCHQGKTMNTVYYRGPCANAVYRIESVLLNGKAVTHSGSSVLLRKEAMSKHENTIEVYLQ